MKLSTWCLEISFQFLEAAHGTDGDQLEVRSIDVAAAIGLAGGARSKIMRSVACRERHSQRSKGKGS